HDRREHARREHVTEVGGRTDAEHGEGDRDGSERAPEERDEPAEEEQAKLALRERLERSGCPHRPETTSGQKRLGPGLGPATAHPLCTVVSRAEASSV